MPVKSNNEEKAQCGAEQLMLMSRQPWLYGVALHSRAVQCHCVQNNWECKVPSLLLWVISDKPTAGVIYGQASGVPSPPPPPNGMVWYGVGGGGGGWERQTPEHICAIVVCMSVLLAQGGWL